MFSMKRSYTMSDMRYWMDGMQRWTGVELAVGTWTSWLAHWVQHNGECTLRRSYRHPRRRRRMHTHTHTFSHSFSCICLCGLFIFIIRTWNSHITIMNWLNRRRTSTAISGSITSCTLDIYTLMGSKYTSISLTLTILNTHTLSPLNRCTLWLISLLMSVFFRCPNLWKIL